MYREFDPRVAGVQFPDSEISLLQIFFCTFALLREVCMYICLLPCDDFGATIDFVHIWPSK